MSRKKTTIGKIKLKKIGERIRALWKSTDLNQTEFGKSIGISQSSVSDLVRGLYPPSKPTLLAIHNQYSVKPDAILTGEGFSPSKITYPSIKNEIDSRPVYKIHNEFPTPPDPVDQIMQGFAQLFKDQKKEIEKLHDLCNKVLRKFSDLEKKFKKMQPGAARRLNAGNAEAGSGSHVLAGDATRKKES